VTHALASKKNKNRQKQQATATKSAYAGPSMPQASVIPLQAEPLVKPSTNSAVAGVVAWLFCALVIIGFITFRTEGTLPRGNMMSVDRAMFAVVNAATLTGFQQTSWGIDQYNPPGQWMILALTIAGTLFALIVGGIAVVRIARLPYSDLQIAGAAVVSQTTVLTIGLLTLHHAKQPFVANLLQSSSAFGNSGLWMGAEPTLLDWRTHLVLMPLALLGGFGLPIIMDFIDALRRKRALSNHTITVLKISAIVYLAALVLCFTLRWPTNANYARLSLASSSAEAINARSAGLPIEYAADFPRYIQWILILLMIIGPAPGGAGGGLKVTTVGKLFCGVRDTLFGRNPGRIFGIAVVWLLTFLTLIFVSFLCLLYTDPGLDADRLLFIATSAAANVGLAHDRVGIVGTGMYVLTLTMLLGRILPIVILWWVLRHAEETDVAIG
jgi:Trk-type K+ transport system membrane component